MRVTDTLAFVRGDWHIERSLTDHRAGAEGCFTGRASFVPVTGDPAALRYAEQGRLRYGGHAGPAGRALLWLPAPGGAADVRFADGRAFYLADLRSGSWQADHRCGRDLYLVSYLVLAGDRLEERWRATGPGKDYQIVTTLTRLPDRS
jgi:hypothetical protein